MPAIRIGFRGTGIGALHIKRSHSARGAWIEEARWRRPRAVLGIWKRLRDDSHRLFEQMRIKPVEDYVDSFSFCPLIPRSLAQLAVLDKSFGAAKAVHQTVCRAADAAASPRVAQTEGEFANQIAASRSESLGDGGERERPSLNAQCDGRVCWFKISRTS